MKQKALRIIAKSCFILIQLPTSVLDARSSTFWVFRELSAILWDTKKFKEYVHPSLPPTLYTEQVVIRVAWHLECHATQQSKTNGKVKPALCMRNEKQWFSLGEHWFILLNCRTYHTYLWKIDQYEYFTSHLSALQITAQASIMLWKVYMVDICLQEETGEKINHAILAWSL